MLLKSIELRNFRQYKGTQRVEFSTDPNKNVTLLLGENTSGKTTVIQAFRWVLYEDCNFTGTISDKKTILNAEVRRELKQFESAEASVTLDFVHRGTTYEVFRLYHYDSESSGDATWEYGKSGLYFYDGNGERKLVKNPHDKIREIFPEELSDYFFFDGEKISKSRSAGNVKSSINTIMGLVPLEHMRNHLQDGRTKNVITTYRNSMKGSSAVSEINKRIGSRTVELEQEKKRLRDAQDRFAIADQLVIERSKEMERIEAIADDAKRLRKVEEEITSIQKSMEGDVKEIISSSPGAIAEIIAGMVADDLLEKMRLFEYDDKGIPDMTAVSVNHIIARGKCICGADLTEHPECVSELKELLSYLPPESIGSQIRHLNDSLDRLSKSSSAQKTCKAYHSTYEARMERIESLEDQRRELEDKIGKCRDADEIKAKFDEQKRNRNQFNEECRRFTNNCENLKKELESLNKELANAGSTDAFNKDIVSKMEYVKALYNRADEMYKRSSDEILTEFREVLTEVFNSMYHGKRTIELTDSYKVQLSVGGERLDNSKGLDTVQNFAFVSTLLKVARGRMDSELESEPYPLAMDAVFSNTDDKHIRNICSVLPKLAEQAVLAIMDKDWEIAAQTLESSVGRKYVIEKVSETHSEIKEVQRWPNRNLRWKTRTRSARCGSSRGSTPGT